MRGGAARPSFAVAAAAQSVASVVVHSTWTVRSPAAQWGGAGFT